jgi:long-chain acyl-CoA synthetase
VGCAREARLVDETDVGDGVRLLRRAGLVVRREATLGTILEELAAFRGDATLFDEPGAEPTTVAEAADRVARWAGALAARVEPGDRVVLATPNGYGMFLACLAASRAGAIPVPVNPQMTEAEVAHVVADSTAALVVHDLAELEPAGAPRPLARAVPAGSGDVAALFYTSGTTGAPKGAELSHRALIGTVLPAAAWPAGLRRDEAVFALPVAHIMGFVVLAAMACGGIPVHVLPAFHPVAVLDAIESRRATVFVGVPAMFRLLVEAGAAERDLTSVRLWASGADAMPAELARTFKRFGATATLPFLGPVGEATFAEGYGLVETAGGVALKVSPPLVGLGLGEGLGVPFPGYHLRVVDDEGGDLEPGGVGELWVRGPGVIRGYWAAPEASAAAITPDGWLRTGDLARRGPLGTVRFAGRRKDVIKRGGYSVYALEVQQALEEHPQVLEAAVVGLPDERLGEVPGAVVRLAPGVTLDGLDLPAWAAARLSEHKVPARFVAVDELPRTGTTKVRRHDLAALFG